MYSSKIPCNIRAPNIYGYAGGILNAASGSQAGALSMERGRNHVGQELGNETAYTPIVLNAESYNSIYGKSSTVQPNSAQLLMIIKS